MLRPSANGKGDNEMIPGIMHISPGIYFAAEENPVKPQLEDGLMKTMRPVPEDRKKMETTDC